MAEKDKKKSGVLKFIMVLVLVLIIFPMLVLSGIYFINDDFKQQANRVLSHLPGSAGDYFASFPTEEEISQQITEIAEYMLSIDKSRAVDKLIILQNDDPKSYDAIIKTMLRMNPNETKLILESIREASVKTDAISSTLDEIAMEKDLDLENKANYLLSLSLPTAVEEMGYIMNSSVNGHKELAEILDKMEVNDAARLMEQLTSADFNKVISYMSTEKKSQIRNQIANMEIRKNELVNVAVIYETEAINNLVDIIGNTATYSLDELAVIYENLSPIKAGKVLASVEDDQFVFDLINTIKEKQIIEHGEDKITADILKSLKVYKEFDDNVNELTTIYGKMTSDRVATLITKMFRNSSAPKEYELENGEIIVITDEDIALELLSRFTDKQVADILSKVDSTLSSEITRKMALPEY